MWLTVFVCGGLCIYVTTSMCVGVWQLCAAECGGSVVMHVKFPMFGVYTHLFKALMLRRETGVARQELVPHMALLLRVGNDLAWP